MYRILILYACGCLVVYGRPPNQKDESSLFAGDKERNSRSEIWNMLADGLFAVQLDSADNENASVDDPEKEIITEENELTDGTRVDGGVIDQGDLVIDENDQAEELYGRPPYVRNAATFSEEENDGKVRSDVLNRLVDGLLAVREIESYVGDPEKEVIPEENEADENDPEEEVTEENELLSGTQVDGGVVMQGDMVIKENDFEATNDGTYGYKRQLIRSTIRRWPNGVVPYVFNFGPISRFSSAKSKLKQAMAEWSAKTCVKFVKRTNERDYVEFISNGMGGECWSHVGRNGGKQQLSLGFGCRSKGIAMHEIGHLLGLFHEQSRPDRDRYVTILRNNIKSDRLDDFEKYGYNMIDDGNSPYDYDSIMHYSSTHFNNGFFTNPTTIQTPNGQKIGQRDHLSVQDVMQIRRAYNC